MKLFIADETEAELDEDYRTTIGDNYKKMLNNDPSILSEVLITTSQNPCQMVGILVLSVIVALSMAAQHNL